MKKISVIMIALLFGAVTILNAETPIELAFGGWGQEDVEVEVDIKGLEDLKKLKQLDEEQIQKIEIAMSGQYDQNAPLMGVYLQDLDFKQAYEMHYNYNYGVLLSGIVPGGGAQQGGLMKGDIIMEFDGQKPRYEGMLSTMIKSKKVGDVVKVKFFRNEQIYETDVVLQSRAKPKIDMETGELLPPAKKRMDAGSGGGGWIPIWYIDKNKFEDINKIIKDFGFTELRDNGMFLNGFGGKGNIGKNWFLGGMGEWYEIDRMKISDTGERRMKYAIGFGGVTLDKRIPLSRNLVTSLGFMLGWGGHSLELSNIGSTYNWDSLSVQVVDPTTNNNYVKLTKNYILLNPKLEVIYRLTDWLGIRAAVGYMFSYSYHSGWNANMCDDLFEITGSPETKLDGVTISIGPWFGF